MSAAEQMSDLEEGEIEDSDTGVDNDTNNTGPTPLISAVEELDQRVFPMKPQPSVDRSYRSTRNPCMDSSGDSSSDDDLDLEDTPVKVKSRRMDNLSQQQRGNMSKSSISANPHGDAFNLAAKKYKQSKSTEMWNSVVTEQTLNDTLLKVNTVEKTLNQDDRGVESYNFMNKHNSLESYEDDFLGGDLYGEARDEVTTTKIDSVKAMSYDDIQGADKDVYAQENSEPEVNIGDVESFGTGPAPSRKRSIKDRIGKRPPSSHSSRSNSPTEHRPNVRERLGKQGTAWHEPPRKFVAHATFNLQASQDDPQEKVAMEILRALGEPEYQTELFFRVVTSLGVKKCLELYYATENIEENGGMVILNGQRRRTPGGVFLQLVKKDTTPEMAKVIFPEIKRVKRRRNRPKKNKEKRMDDDGDHGDHGDHCDPDDFPLKTDAFLKENPMDAGVTMETATRGQGEPDAADRGTDEDLEEDDCVNIQLGFPETAVGME